MTFQRLFLVPLLALGLLDLAGDARAGSPSPEQIARANAALKSAAAKLREKKYPEAEKLLLDAWALSPTYDIAHNLGTTECLLNKPAKCVDHLTFALRTWPLVDNAKGTAARRAAEEMRAEARKLVGAVSLTTNVAGAEIAVDGQPLGTAPITEEIYLDPGPHTLTATLAKYQTARAKVDVVKGGTDKVALTLLDEVNAPPPPPEAQPTASPVASAAPPSSSAPLPPPPSRPNLFCVIVPGVVAAAGVGLGVFFAVASNGHATDAAAASARLSSKRCPAGGADCEALTQALTSRDSSANAAMGMFIGGGVFGVAALAAGIWRATVPAAPPDTRAARLLPVLSPNQMGLVFDGTW
jgi:hypothetical protein